MLLDKEKEFTQALTPIISKCIRQYIECSDEVRSVINDMIHICEDPETDEDERNAAYLTLSESLFPQYHQNELGMDLNDADIECARNSPDGQEALLEVDREEINFAQKLYALMKEKGLTQKTLAELTGVSQPAIASMLSRNCRPQNRTIKKLAEALNVSVKELWPS